MLAPNPNYIRLAAFRKRLDELRTALAALYMTPYHDVEAEGRICQELREILVKMKA